MVKYTGTIRAQQTRALQAMWLKQPLMSCIYGCQYHGQVSLALKCACLLGNGNDLTNGQ